MTTYSKTPGPALQRSAENVAALAGELCDRDRIQQEILAELERAMAHSLPAREVVHYQRRLLSKVVVLQKADDLTDGELADYGRKLAGDTERFNAYLYENAKEKAPSLLMTDPEPRKPDRCDCSTCPSQLTLSGEAE